jgi:hypothetical protein
MSTHLTLIPKTRLGKTASWIVLLIFCQSSYSQMNGMPRAQQDSYTERDLNSATARR